MGGQWSGGGVTGVTGRFNLQEAPLAPGRRHAAQLGQRHSCPLGANAGGAPRKGAGSHHSPGGRSPRRRDPAPLPSPGTLWTVGPPASTSGGFRPSQALPPASPEPGPGVWVAGAVTDAPVLSSPALVAPRVNGSPVSLSGSSPAASPAGRCVSQEHPTLGP